MAETAANVFRDFNSHGVPASGEYKPEKVLIRRWGRELENAVAAFQSNGGLVYASKSALDADLAHGANSSAWVIGDETAANNGIYRKSGASGAGSWSRVADLPYSFIRVDNAGAGTADAIVATSDVPAPEAPFGALYLMNVAEANDGAVTVAINGADPKPLMTNSGGALGAGYLTAGMLAAFVDDGTSYRLVSDVTSAAIQAAAEDAADRAEAAAVAAASGNVATREALKALSTTLVTIAHLTEPGREGTFVFRAGDYSAEVAADTAEGIYIAADGVEASEGAWIRTYSGTPSAAWWGVGEEAADNADALEAALAASGALAFPPGVFSFGRAVTIPSADTMLVGAGSGVTHLRWTSVSDGLVFDGGSVTQGTSNRLALSGISVETTQAGAGAAVQCTYSGGGGTTNRLVQATDVRIAGIGLSAYWEVGFDCNNVRNSTFVDCEVVGSSNSQRAMTAGFRLGDSENENPVDNRFISCTAYFQQRAMDVGSDGAGNAEGIIVDGCTFVSNDYGVYWHTAGNKPLLCVVGSHIASGISCIYGRRLIQEVIQGNDLYIRDETDSDFIAIDIQSDLSALAGGCIVGNHIRCNSALTPITNGILINQLRTIVAHNTIQAPDTGIEFGSNSASCQASGNNIFQPVSAAYVDSGTFNRIDDPAVGTLRESTGVPGTNYLEVNHSSSSQGPRIVADGTGADVGMRFATKGGGVFQFLRGLTEAFRIIPISGAANRLEVLAAGAGSPPSLRARGETDVDLHLDPAGAGVVRFGEHTASSDVAVTGYITIKDGAGTVRKLAVIN